MQKARLGIRIQRDGGVRERGGWVGCSTCQRGLRISFTGGLGLCVGRHDGVKHGWRQRRGSPIRGGGDRTDTGEVGLKKTQNNISHGEPGGVRES